MGAHMVVYFVEKRRQGCVHGGNPGKKHHATMTVLELSNEKNQHIMPRVMEHPNEKARFHCPTWDRPHIDSTRDSV